MRILVYKWSAYAFDDVLHSFEKLNIGYDIMQYDFDAEGRSKHYDEEFVAFFKKEVSPEKYDALFSIAYWAALSDAAMAVGLKYISWSYDCPLDTKDPMRTFGNPCNYMFLFDRFQTNEYLSQGLATVYHMPLGINADRYSRIRINEPRLNKYKTDVSFIGNLYTGKADSLKLLMSDKTASIIQKIVDTQKNMPGENVLHKLITQGFINALNQDIEATHPNIIGNLSVAGVENTLAYEVTNYNRLILLMLCAKRFKTDLYTGTELIDVIDGLHVHGKVDYYKEMPWIFAASRVNLNHTFLSIQSGLPLRVLDIMASGGLLVSNRQPEFADKYIEDKEVVLFTDFAEAVEKITFYLGHENIRSEIAKQGRKKTFIEYRMEDRIKDMLNIAL